MRSVARRREAPFCSTRYATPTSNIEMAEVKAANTMVTKKRMATTALSQGAEVPIFAKM